MKKKMKPATRSLIITLCVLVVLAAAAAVLLVSAPDSPGEETSSASSAKDTAEIIAKDITKVKDVTVTNEHGTYHINTRRDTDAAVPTFYVQELSDIATSSTALQAIARHAYVLSASVDLGPTAELHALSEYGLDKPAATLASTFTDGSDPFELKIGNKATSGYYVLANDHVYIVSVDEAVFASMYSFIESSLYTIPIKGDGSDVVDYVKLTGTDFEQPITMIYTGGSENHNYNALFMPYVITEPYLSGVNTEKIDMFVKTLAAPQGAGTAGYNPTEELLAETGLDEPAAVCEFSINGEAHVVRIGDVYDGSFRYMMADDNPVVFVIGKEAVPWAELNVQALRDGFVWSPVIKKTNGLKITCDGKVWDYTLTRAEDTTASSSSAAAPGAVKYVYSARLNGKDIEYDDFRKVFTPAIAATVLATEERETEEKPVVTLEYSYYEGGTTTVEFFPVKDGERRYAAYVAGEFVGIVKETFINDLKKALP